jgi:hypothetical protein
MQITVKTEWRRAKGDNRDPEAGTTSSTDISGPASGIGADYEPTPDCK